VNRLKIMALVGLGALQACSASDDAPERPPVDAGRDTRTTPRADAPGADRLDAGGADAEETSAPPVPDAGAPDATLPPPDVTSPPPDAGPPEVGPPLDRTPPPPPSDAPPLPDGTMDATLPSCVVTFTVSGVRWDAPEGGADAQAGARIVRLVGDAANIGSWMPTAGVPLTETVSGTWSGTAVFRDQQLTEFKFVKVEGVTPEWETWTPYDSNRSLRVDCFGDGGGPGDAGGADAMGDAPADRSDGDGASVDIVSDNGGDATSDAPAPPDADVNDAEGGAQDAGAPDDVRVVPVPARGKTYTGVFGVRPLDATK
jgi:hypothetical protein